MFSHIVHNMRQLGGLFFIRTATASQLPAIRRHGEIFDFQFETRQKLLFKITISAPRKLKLKTQRKWVLKCVKSKHSLQSIRLLCPPWTSSRNSGRTLSVGRRTKGRTIPNPRQWDTGFPRDNYIASREDDAKPGKS